MELQDLQERIEIGKPTTTNNSGSVETSWSTVATVWANVTPISGNEKYDADGKLVHKKYSFKIRKRDDIDEQMRIKFNDKFYDITSIDPFYKEMRNSFQYIEASYNQKKSFK